jgi:hypothetical protein
MMTLSLACVVLLCFAGLASAKGATESDLQVVTFATDPQRAFFLLRGLEHHKHARHTVLGQGQTFTGSLHKVEMLRQHLAVNASATDVVLVCDGYFAFITGGPKDVIARYLAAQADVVFAAKGGTGAPDDRRAVTRFKYLSSGAFIGKASVLREIIALDSSEFATDEDFFKHVLKQAKFNIRLDSGKRIFGYLGDHENDDSSDVLVEDKRFLIRETASFPLVLFGSAAGGMHCFYRTLRRKVHPLVQISKVDIFPLSLKQGETLWLQLTVANFNEFSLMPQHPYPAYVYDDRRDFSLDGFAAESAAFRIGVDYAERREGADHPYRWGLGEKILSGNEKTIVLGVTMNRCFPARREYALGYVFENFFWQINIKKVNVTVTCK